MSTDMSVQHDLFIVSKRLTFVSSIVIKLIIIDISKTNVQHIRLFITIKKLTPQNQGTHIFPNVLMVIKTETKVQSIP